MNRKRKSEGEKGVDETVAVERKCTNPVPADAFDIFSQGEDSESCGNSWRDLLRDSCGLSYCGSEALSGVPVVSDVLVSSSSAMVVMSGASLSDSDWEIVELQSLSFSRERRAVWVENQET